MIYFTQSRHHQENKLLSPDNALIEPNIYRFLLFIIISSLNITKIITILFRRFLLCVWVNTGAVSAGCHLQQLVCASTVVVHTLAAEDGVPPKPVQRSVEESRGKTLPCGNNFHGLITNYLTVLVFSTMFHPTLIKFT